MVAFVYTLWVSIGFFAILEGWTHVLSICWISFNIFNFHIFSCSVDLRPFLEARGGRDYSKNFTSTIEALGFLDHLEMTPLESEIHPIAIPYCYEFSRTIYIYDQLKYCYLLPLAAITWEFPGRFPNHESSMVVTSRQGLHWIWNYRKPRSHVQASLKPSFGTLAQLATGAVFEGQLETGTAFFCGNANCWTKFAGYYQQKIYEHIISLCLYNSFMMLVSAGSVSGIGICQQNPKNCSWIFNLRYEYYLDTIPITYLAPFSDRWTQNIQRRTAVAIDGSRDEVPELMEQMWQERPWK